MLKEAIEKIVSLADPHIYKVGDENFTNDHMTRIDPKIDRPEAITLHSLDGIVKSVLAELNRSEITKPIFVCPDDYDTVSVFTTLRKDNQKRDMLYTASAVLPHRAPEEMTHDEAMIALRSRFVPNEGTEYLLNLLSTVNDESGVKSTDNGVTQVVEARTGVALKSNVRVNPIVRLAPYRTFLEVEQPESEFLLRLKPGDKEKGRSATVSLIEADGGAWKLAAKHAIAEYFREAFSEVDSRLIIVAE